MQRLVVCPQCHSRNRIPAEHAGRPVCGRCKTPLPEMPLIEELTDATFAPALTADSRPLLVDFWAPWCGPCRMLTPVVEQFAQRHPQLRVAKLNTENNTATASRFAISSIPCLILFQNGKESKRIVGAVGLAELEYQLHAYIT